MLYQRGAMRWCGLVHLTRRTFFKFISNASCISGKDTSSLVVVKPIAVAQMRLAVDYLLSLSAKSTSFPFMP